MYNLDPRLSVNTTTRRKVIRHSQEIFIAECFINSIGNDRSRSGCGLKIFVKDALPIIELYDKSSWQPHNAANTVNIAMQDSSA